MAHLSTVDSSLAANSSAGASVLMLSGIDSSVANPSGDLSAMYSHTNRVVQYGEYITVVPKSPAFIFGEKVVLPFVESLKSLWGAVDRVVSSVFSFLPGAKAQPVNERAQAEALAAHVRQTQVHRDFAGSRHSREVMQFPASFNLTTLNGTNGFAVNSLRFDFLGTSVSGIGDVNGDGIQDIALGAPADSHLDGAYVLFGTEDGWPATFNLTTLNGRNGFVVSGLARFNGLGTSVSGLGDVNGDGLQDFALGAPYASPDSLYQVGAAYVVLGRASGWPPLFELKTLNGTNGFVVNGCAAGDELGTSVSGVGDINGDGIQDLALGAPEAGSGEFSHGGSAYILFGASKWLPSFNLTTLDGKNGFAVSGTGFLGESLSGVGDVNGDGIHDFALGSPATAHGSAYIIFGSKSGWSPSFDLTTLNGKNGFAVNGLRPYEALGYAVSGVGDINADGKQDLVFGAPATSDNTQAGSAYVLFGSVSEWPPSFNLTTLNGKNGFAVNGLAAGDELGISVKGTGDINGDGIQDVVLGASKASPEGLHQAGAAYILFGTANGWLPSFDLTTLNGKNGFVVNGLAAGDELGTSVSGAQDINGNGTQGLTLGAPGSLNEASSAAYVLFGAASSGSISSKTDSEQ